MKKVLSVISAIALLLCIFSVNAFCIDDSLVDDRANLFDETQEEEISSSISNFILNTSYFTAVVTTDDADGKSSEDYADDYHDNLIDSEGYSENGILFLIDTDNHNVWISTTGEAIYTYDDYTINYIIDSGYDYLVSGEYAASVLRMIETAENLIVQSESDEEIVEEHYYYFHEDVYEDEYYNSNIHHNNNTFNFTDVIIYIVIGLVIAAITVFAVKSSYKNHGKDDEFDEDDILLNLTGSTDNVISRNVITTRIPRNNNNNRPGGGVSHGGSSVHRSSGGRSHGGGGRSF